MQLRARRDDVVMLKNKLCLGTVQFGLEYGINNKTGKPGQEQVFAMLDHARAENIEYIDTAAAYGNAEEVIGAWFDSRGCQDEFKVISKLRPNLIEEGSRDVADMVIEQVQGSLQRLRLKRLNGYLLHTPANFYNPMVIKGLQEAKNLGLTENIGVSIYEVETAMDVVQSGLVDYIQIPFNVLDQRLARGDFYRIARDNGMLVFARSPFLQGLLFMEPAEVPDRVAEARGYVEEFGEIATRHGFSRAEACMLLSLISPGHDFVVFGVDNLQQLQEDLNVEEKGRDTSALVADLEQRFVNIEKAIIFPSLWANK